MEHRFGGAWTDAKLARVGKYLSAYTKIFSTNPQARFFRTIYVDAFAGTGTRTAQRAEDPQDSLFDDVATDEEARQFKAGSVEVALGVSPEFDRYVFIESDRRKVEALRSQMARHPGRREHVEILPGDANEALLHLARATDWRRNRAVVFLDPYGMSVEWATLEALAGTRAIDLWLLFPLGQAVNRLLLRREVPGGGFARALTRCFGTEAWREAFYQASPQGELFGGAPGVEKIASFGSIAAFFRERLASIFVGVAPTSLPLVNSRNNPLFLLCFAASNEKGAPTALRIANDILEG